MVNTVVTVVLQGSILPCHSLIGICQQCKNSDYPDYSGYHTSEMTMENFKQKMCEQQQMYFDCNC